MRRPGVNLTVLWEEYREAHPDGYGYSRFCDLYREFERRFTPVMRQHHAAGDKVFVDYSGKKVGIVATALLDRLLHNTVVIQIEGASYRLRQHADLVPEHVRSKALIVPPPAPRRRGRPPGKAASDHTAG